MVEVWTEVLNEGIVAVWAWDGKSLGVVPVSMDGYHLDEKTAGAIGQYADDKEVNMTVEAMHEAADYDGSIETFVNEELKA